MSVENFLGLVNGPSWAKKQQDSDNLSGGLVMEECLPELRILIIV